MILAVLWGGHIHEKIVAIIQAEWIRVVVVDLAKKVIGFWILKVSQRGLLVDLTCVCMCLWGGAARGV